MLPLLLLGVLAIGVYLLRTSRKGAPDKDAGLTPGSTQSAAIPSPYQNAGQIVCLLAFLLWLGAMWLPALYYPRGVPSDAPLGPPQYVSGGEALFYSLLPLSWFFIAGIPCCIANLFMVFCLISTVARWAKRTNWHQGPSGVMLFFLIFSALAPWTCLIPPQAFFCGQSGDLEVGYWIWACSFLVLLVGQMLIVPWQPARNRPNTMTQSDGDPARGIKGRGKAPGAEK